MQYKKHPHSINVHIIEKLSQHYTFIKHIYVIWSDQAKLSKCSYFVYIYKYLNTDTNYII